MYTILELLKTNKTVFTNEDMAYIWGTTNENSLKKAIQYLVKKGKLIRIKKGLYAVEGRKYDVFELANRYKTPSYISFTTVLLKAGVVFQYSSEVYLASNNSKKIEIDGNNFIYKKISDPILFNPEGLVVEGNYTIATAERAFLDTLYLDRNFYFDNLGGVNFEKALRIAEIYQNKSLLLKVKQLKKRKEKDV